MFRLAVSTILSAFNKLTEKTFLRGATPAQRFNKTDGRPIPQPPDRAARKYTRDIYQLFRHYDQRIGYPKLTGDRKLRTISNIYGIPFQIVVWHHFNGTLSPEIERLRAQRHLQKKTLSIGQESDVAEAY